MTKINLSNIQSYFITLENDPDNAEISHVLRSLGLNAQPTPGIIHESKMKAAGQAAAVNNLVSSHLQKGKFEPFIVFEEDARPTKNFSLKPIIIPEDADCLYLGMIGGKGFGNPLLSKVDKFPGVYRVDAGLIGAHAMLFLTEKFAKATLEATHKLSNSKDYPEILDPWVDGMHGYGKELLEQHNFYAIDPMFYQHNPKTVKISNYSHILSLDPLIREDVFEYKHTK